MTTPKTNHTPRYIEFNDTWPEVCDIRESSSARTAVVWLGAERGGYMHLTRPQTRWLTGLLTVFAETGELSDMHEPPSYGHSPIQTI